MRATLIAAMLLGACEPEPVPVRSQVPEISVVPDVLAFGDAVVPLPAFRTVTVTNAGQSTLTGTVDLTGDAAFVLDTTEFSLGPDESAAVGVTFTPPTFLDYAGELTFTSNDEDEEDAVLRFPVTGTGVLGPIPDIDVPDRTLDFGTLTVGDDDAKVLVLRNVGTADLRLGDLSLTGSGAFSLLGDPSGFTIPAQQFANVIVQYEPTSDAGDDARLVIPSDDPDEPSVDVVLIGNGGSDIDFPVAVIDTEVGPCPVTTAPPQWIALDGAASTDPEGRTPLTYAWTLLDRPPGSQAKLNALVGPDSRLFTDIAGNYRVSLQVENAIGTRSAPAVCSLQAIPADALHVELAWDGTAADLDLHLVREDAALYDSPDDVSWCNKNPKWGDQANTEDDPRLDLDVQNGLGPENINILAPADGRYRVLVHYFDDNGDGRQQATVRIYVNGSTTPDFEVSQVIDRDQVWEVAEVRWPAATVAPLSVVPYTAANRVCY
jgi:hypothetical protein